MLFSIRSHYNLVGRFVAADRLGGRDPGEMLGAPCYCLVQRSPFEGDRARAAGTVWCTARNVEILRVRDVFLDGVGRPDGRFDVYFASFSHSEFADEFARRNAAAAEALADVVARAAREGAKEAGDTREFMVRYWESAAKDAADALAAIAARGSADAVVEAVQQGLRSLGGPPPKPRFPLGAAVAYVASTDAGASVGVVEGEITGAGLRGDRIVYHFPWADDVPECDVYPDAAAAVAASGQPVIAPERHKAALEEEEAERWRPVFAAFLEEAE